MSKKHWEESDKVSDLVKAAKECVQYLNEDSVGYHYMAMLETLEKLDNGNLVIPLHRFKRKKTRGDG